MFILPLYVDVPMYRYPVANILLMIGIALFSIMFLLGDDRTFHGMVLDGFTLRGMIGHILLHADLLHLVGNLIFLWAFGNAICAKVGNFNYPALFLGLGIIAAAIHNILDGHPAIGASGAINGVVGMVLVLYPRNEVACFWFFFMRGGMFYVSSMWLILLWLAFDLWGVVTGDLGVAYWGHIGGLLGGAAVAMLMLKTGLIEIADTDQTLLDILEQRRG